MADQSSSNVLAAIKAQGALGTAASGAGATRIRANDSPGLKMVFGRIQSGEKRSDQLKTMGRLGNQEVQGSFNCEFGVGGEHDILIQAILRSTFGAAVTRTYDNSAGLTSLEITADDTITQVGTTTLIGVIFKGDIITLAGMSNAANNDIRLRVTNVTATVITVAKNAAGVGPLTVQAADIACTLTRMKKIISPAAPVLPYFTIEQYDGDHDRSQYFFDTILTGMKLTCAPDEHIMVAYTFLGLDGVDLDTGTSPYFTTPTLTTGLKLIATDSFIRRNNGDVAKFTGFEVDFQIAAAVTKTIGSRKGVIFANDLTVAATISSLRSDFAHFTALKAVSEFETSIMMQEPGVNPKPTMGLYLPRCKFADVGGPYGGGDGGKVDTLELIVGPKTAGTIDDGSIANFFSSAA